VRPQASTDGHLAVAVPGTVAGLYEVHRRYGKLSWQQVVSPAIQLAAQGFPVSWRLAAAISGQKTLLNNPAGRQIFTRNGVPLGLGDRLIQTDLAKTLTAIAADPQSFYTGKVGAAIVRDMAANGGLITQKDLQNYRPIWREPVCGNFHQTRICSMPPPSSGGVHLLQMLNMIDLSRPTKDALKGADDFGSSDFAKLGWHSPDALHLLIESMRIAYADRAEYLGDPAFVAVPVAALISPAYANRRRQEIDPQRARPSSSVTFGDPKLIQRLNSAKESSETSHLNTVDAAGNAVSLTFTINLGFGAGVVATGTGIVLNNEMDDFAIAPNVPNAFGLVGRDANAISPGKTPLSSMTPTIVTENNQIRLVTGSPGGSTIITTVLQIVLNVLIYDMPVDKAVAAPRLHHQWLPDRTLVDRWGFDPLTLAELRRRGHQFTERQGWGNASAIVRQPDGLFVGAADPRGEGAAIGF
jgi:gamma-glutamyltranspeptidase / glutathione hydrolase